MKKKVLIKLAYDGSGYPGWQRQKNIDAIENVVENACKKAFGADAVIIGASRTDRGVHARCQVIVIKIDTEKYKPQNVAKALTTKLPLDIIAYESYEVKDDFHPRYNKSIKTYEYKIYNNFYKLPQHRNYVGHVKSKLNVEKMIEAAKQFVGEHDFKSFCMARSAEKDTVREVKHIAIEKCEDNIIKVTVEGNGFLHNMVRIIVGTLIWIGEEKIEENDIKKMLNSKNRIAAGPTAPAEGLTLLEIKYIQNEKLI